jgi:hypothetical protein
MEMSAWPASAGRADASGTPAGNRGEGPLRSPGPRQCGSPHWKGLEGRRRLALASSAGLSGGLPQELELHSWRAASRSGQAHPTFDPLRASPRLRPWSSPRGGSRWGGPLSGYEKGDHLPQLRNTSVSRKRPEQDCKLLHAVWHKPPHRVPGSQEGCPPIERNPGPARTTHRSRRGAGRWGGNSLKEVRMAP